MIDRLLRKQIEDSTKRIQAIKDEIYALSKQLIEEQELVAEATKLLESRPASGIYV